jgi:hypothetical protein
LPCIAVLLAGWGVLLAQKPFKQYDITIEHNNFPLPEDWDKPTDWVFARLKYRDPERAQYGDSYYWTMDYPQGDRHLAIGIRRLTTVDVRSVEQVTELDGTDDIYNWPFLYGVEVGHVDFTMEQAEQLRDYLLRGGFLMVDDFHGRFEWERFEYGMSLVFPDRPIVDLQQTDAIFHTLSDVDQLIQIPSAQYINSGLTYERADGYPANWRGILDDKGRVMVVINHNMDLGDAIEWSDNPRYPENFASTAYRVVTNYVVYNLTH